jgi:predicted N-formylglutamate amidohydrolase
MRGLLHVMVEIRNDLIADEPGQKLWADRLAAALMEPADAKELGYGT